ncbi:MAG TPA: lipid-binding SYLF domain-containing protein [Firmicutes bacterium]|jgi:lipid-binding SYLF domain-containing protein|nr:lipid-binding SYLF domain-containing protein [Bacillota bacterium]
MRKVLLLVLVAVLMATGVTSAAKLPAEILEGAADVLMEMTQQPDSEQFQNMVRNAYGIAIFPSVVKAGLGIGGRYGEGVVLKRDRDTGEWYGPYFVEMVGVSYGLQIGVQSTALVLVVATEEGIKTLQEGRITLGGNISMAAGPVGRSAEAGTDIQLKASMYSYSISRGVFAGASLEGSSINNNESANKLYWGEELTPSQMLSKEAKGESIQVLLNTLASITE